MKKISFTLHALLGAAVMLPSISLAAVTTPQAFQDSVDFSSNSLIYIVGILVRLVNSVVPLFLSIAVVVFCIGIVRYIIAEGPNQKKDAKNIIIFGVVSIAVILAMFGLTTFLLGFLGLSTGSDRVGYVLRGTGPLAVFARGALAVLNSFVPLLIGLAVLAFISGIVRYLWHSDSVKSRENGRTLMVGGIVALAVILSTWSLAFFVKDIFFQGSNIPLNDGGPLDGGTDYCIQRPFDPNCPIAPGTPGNA
jgi:cyanate permease